MEWKINKSTKICGNCEKEFYEEEEYFSALFDENNAFIRKDFCLPCWEKGKGQGLFSFWKTKIPKKDKPVQKVVNIEMFLDMFTRLDGSSETHHINMRYVLALYLIRKRIFKLKSFQKREQGEFLIIVDPKEDRELSVFNPCLKDKEIDAITYELEQLMTYSCATEQNNLSKASR